MKAAQYRDMSMEELLDSINQLRTELFNLRLGNTTKELQNTSRLGQARRDLARALTVLGEKERAEAAAKA
jgi:large subunit ribosomal protein L29